MSKRPANLAANTLTDIWSRRKETKKKRSNGDSELAIVSLLSDDDDTDGSDVIINDENESVLWTAVNTEMNQECSSKVCEATSTGHQSSPESVTDTEQSLLGSSTECHCESSSLRSPTAPASLDQPLAGNSTVHSSTACELLCCHSLDKPYQPRDDKSLSCLTNCKRNFMAHWYKDYPWLSVCITKQKVFCYYCRYVDQHCTLNFSNRGEDTFTTNGFNNWKKALEKFKTHALSITHREAVMKFQLLQQPPISNHLDAHAKKCQTSRRNALLKQLNAIKFLLRQGIAMRGHDETEGNLYQLLIMLSNDCPVVKSYVHEKNICHMKLLMSKFP